MKYLILMLLSLSSVSFAQRGGSCRENNDQYDSQRRCERFHDRCQIDRRSNCYVPEREERPICNQRRNEFETERECLRQNEYCEYNRSSGCYEPAVPERRCNAKYNEYERSPECESDHSQGCEYRSDIKCYVPKAKPPPPPPPPVCRWQDDDGSYEGRGRRGFRNRDVCEISEGRKSGACEERSDGCWHPRGR